MTIRRDNNHNCIGINIVFKENSTVKIKMKEYLLKCIETFDLSGDKVKRGANIPAKKYLS